MKMAGMPEGAVPAEAGEHSQYRVMVYQFMNQRDFKFRDVVYPSGGIAWVIASLMYPGLIRQNHREFF